MKMGNYIRALGVGILLGILPMMVSAKGSFIEDEHGIRLGLLSMYDIALVDSLPKSKTQDDKKDKDSKKKAEADKEKGQKQDPKTVEIDKEKPNIKEVPKARPKLRPGVVTDKVKIKRPPIKVKPGRVMRSIGL